MFVYRRISTSRSLCRSHALIVTLDFLTVLDEPEPQLQRSSALRLHYQIYTCPCSRQHARYVSCSRSAHGCSAVPTLQSVLRVPRYLLPLNLNYLSVLSYQLSPSANTEIAPLYHLNNFLRLLSMQIYLSFSANFLFFTFVSSWQFSPSVINAKRCFDDLSSSENI